jgi:WD40 repeat protein
MADARLRSLAEMMDDPSPYWSGSLADLKRSWIERAPRGVERTQDQTIGLIAQGDGAFEVYWLQQRVRMAIGRIQAHGCALVFFDPALPAWQLPPAQRAARERLATKLIPHSLSKPRPPNVVVRLGEFEFAAAFSRDGSRLAVWNEQKENRLKIIDLTTGLVCSTFDLQPLNDLRSISFTPDGATLAFGGADRKLWLWHMRPASNPIVLRGHTPKETWSLAFSPDGQTLASAGDDHCIRLWNVETGDERAVLRGHNSLVTSIAFAPDGRTLASASFDLKAPVALWDVATGTLQSVLVGHTQRARSVSFSPDGRTLASGSEDRSVISSSAWRFRPTGARSHRRARTGPCASGMSSRARNYSV